MPGEVKNLMTITPHVIHPEKSLRDAARQMKDNDCGALPVSNGRELVGMLTDRDIVIYGVAKDYDLDETPVTEIMSPEVFTCYSSDSIEKAAEIMGEQDVRRLIVLDMEENVVGILSIADIIKCPDRDKINTDVIERLFQYA